MFLEFKTWRKTPDGTLFYVSCPTNKAFFSMETKKHSFWHRNGLSLTLTGCFLVFWAGQAYTGWQVHNQELTENGAAAMALGSYLRSGHFMSATFENWESEFFQMGIYVLFTVFLRQRGSAESKPMEEPEETDRKPQASPNANWAVRKGGFWLLVYKNSLSLAFAALFLFSFAMHAIGSYRSHLDEQQAKRQPAETWQKYLAGSEFWFESLQNWQSEFVAVLSIVVLSIFLRQQGSPQSKPVDAANSETGT